MWIKTNEIYGDLFCPQIDGAAILQNEHPSAPFRSFLRTFTPREFVFMIAIPLSVIFFVISEEMHSRKTTRVDTASIASSVEFHDAIIDENFVDGYRKARREKEIFESQKGGLIERWIRHFTDRALLKRLEAYEDSELKTFIAQKLFKVDGILCDEQTRLELIQ
ncbi:unnamed protein product, partial [Cylicostephanus goldi]